MRDEDAKYGVPLTELEIEELRCLIGNHYFKDCGADVRHCVNCGKGEER